MSNVPQDPQGSKDLKNGSPHLGDLSFTGFSLATIQIQDGTPDELEQILVQKIDSTHGAFTNSPVVLNVENVANLNTFDFFKLQYLCRQHELF